jgi:hypothetical protein
MNCPQLGKSPITKLIVSIFYACWWIIHIFIFRMLREAIIVLKQNLNYKRLWKASNCAFWFTIINSSK